MNWLRRNPKSGAVLLLAAALLTVELGALRHVERQAERGLSKLEAKRQERDRLVRQSPAPSKENELTIGREIARAEEMLAALQAAFPGADPQPPTGPAPVRAIDAYVDIAAFVERTRLLAARAQVTIKPDEHFGFSSYAHQGPAGELIQAVLHQRMVLQFLLETLFEARPRAFLAGQRERPLAAAQQTLLGEPAAPGKNGSRPAGADGHAGDFFIFEGKSSLRVPGQWDSEAFRLEFSGRTPALRSFLSALASCGLPLIVRSVEVEPLSDGGPSSVDPSPSAAGAPVQLVAQHESRFAVVVEIVALTATARRPAP